MERKNKKSAFCSQYYLCFILFLGQALNIAENELSAMTRQCIAHRRIGDIEILRQEIKAWANATNEKQRGVDWQFKIDQARVKLKSLYPGFID